MGALLLPGQQVLSLVVAHAGRWSLKHHLVVIGASRNDGRLLLEMLIAHEVRVGHIAHNMVPVIVKSQLLSLDRDLVRDRSQLLLLFVLDTNHWVQTLRVLRAEPSRRMVIQHRVRDLFLL